MKCNVVKINFDLPQKMVKDWDDRMCIVTWQDTRRTEKGKVRSKAAKNANPAVTKRATITPSLLAEQLLLSLDIGRP